MNPGTLSDHNVVGLAQIGFVLHRIRAITLDLDDTLWEIGPVIRRAESLLWAWLERECPKIPAHFTHRRSLELREQILINNVDIAHDFRHVRRLVLTEMASTVGYGNDFLDDAFAVFDKARNEVELFPDVKPVLQELSQKFKVIAVTNGNANLEVIGIRQFFHDVVTAVDAGAAKPAQPIFDIAVRKAGVRTNEVLHVGDHPETDIVGATNAGLRTAWMNHSDAEWPDHLPSPDVTVRSVTELRDLLKAAKGRNL